MKEYYFLLSAIPQIEIGKVEITFRELRSLFALNLSEKDQKQVEILLRPTDLYNLRAFWLKAPLDEKGNLTALEIEEALITHDGLPDYVLDYIARFEGADRLKYFASLLSSFYREEASKCSGFLKRYFEFERTLRLILTALRAKRAGRDIVKELQFEELDAPLVMEILAQKDASDYMPPQEFEDLKTIFTDNHSEPLKLEKALLRYRFAKVEEMEEPQEFGLDRVLAYTAKLLIALSLSERQKNLGLELLSRYD